MIQRDQTMTIVCRRPSRCAYCEDPAKRLCDFVKENGKTCDAGMCIKHAWQQKGGENKDYCRIHRRKLEGSERGEKRKAELAEKKRPTLIFIAESKYQGFCKEKDCGARWSAGDPMYWDKETREVFCNECGGMMQI